MKDLETIQRFIQLRVAGWSFVRIAAEFNVTKPTLIQWSRRHQFDIHNLRAVETEALAETYFASRRERWEQIGRDLRRVEAELAQRDLADVPTARLLGLAAKSLRSSFPPPCGPCPTTSGLRRCSTGRFEPDLTVRFFPAVKNGKVLVNISSHATPIRCRSPVWRALRSPVRPVFRRARRSLPCGIVRSVSRTVIPWSGPSLRSLIAVFNAIYRKVIRLEQKRNSAGRSSRFQTLGTPEENHQAFQERLHRIYGAVSNP